MTDDSDLPSPPTAETAPPPRIVFVTGPSGAGRTTAINTLEDLGYEAIDNLPLSLLPRLLEGPAPDRPMALGTDTRNRDFSAATLIAIFEQLHDTPGIIADLLYLDCAPNVLRRRFSETRRRHHPAPDADPGTGIALERDMLGPLRSHSSIMVDTSDLTPQQLRSEIAALFAKDRQSHMAVSVTSFSYRHGIPPAADLVFDCRFLRNPHYDRGLKPRDGRDPEVQAYVAVDPRFEAFVAQLVAMSDLLLPAYEDEGKSHLTIAFGCTGGQHRSVAMAEIMAAHLAEAGWQVSKRHREVEQRRLNTSAVARS